ncbi:unnamed protein product [Plutella xylostella]|uniref:(diamondback moth) hypothetical protein n=1 Tax=Plutella xylostella TaxID=51655 RepID=A0A8S4G2H1_PLUXY|nr:unnamed protein product [Plutella xylostella]
MSLSDFTPVDIALALQKAWRNCSPACHGVLGGLSLMHLLLISFSDSLDAGHLSFHAVVTMPYVAAYYFFCVLCLLSVLDRLDVASLDISRGPQLYFQPIVLVILYTACLLVCAAARMHDELMVYQYTSAVGNLTGNMTTPTVLVILYTVYQYTSAIGNLTGNMTAKHHIRRVLHRIVALRRAKDPQHINLLENDWETEEFKTHLPSRTAVPASQRLIDRDVTRRMNPGWMKWKQLTGTTCDRKMPIKIKGKIYKSVIRPVMLYGAECWATKVMSDERRMHVAEMRMLRWMCGVTRKDRIRPTIPSFYHTWTHLSIWRAVLSILGLVYFVISNPQDMVYANLSKLLQFKHSLQSIG